MNKRIAFAVAAAAALALAAVTFHASAADKLKVGFIGVGPIGDLGWTFQHDVGRQAMVKALGDKVDTTFVENVPEGADAERAIEQLARTGHKLIFTTSFTLSSPLHSLHLHHFVCFFLVFAISPLSPHLACFVCYLYLFCDCLFGINRLVSWR